MSSATPASKGKSKGKAGAKKPFWQMELGKKKGAEAFDEAVEHPPFVPTLPRVNLLPADVRVSVGMRKVRRNLVLAALALLVVAGGVWYLQGSRIDESQARLSVAQGDSQALQSKLDALAPITVLTTALTNQKALVEATLASQPQASAVIDRLRTAGDQAGGKGIDFSTASVTYQGIPAAGTPLNACPNPNPFGTEITIGCITFTASANDRQQVSRLLEIMEADPLFVGPYVTNTSLGVGETGDTAVTFSGTAGVSVEGLETLLTEEQIAAIITPPAPTDAAAPEGGEAQ